MSTSVISVKTNTFEGPLELLIELVEKRKLLINDISLSEVTDEYMQTVSMMQELSLPNTAQFVSLAATLLLIKSKSLLPVLDLTDEETASIEDLESRLKQYQLYKRIAEALSAKFGVSTSYASIYTPPREPVFVPDKNCTLDEIESAMNRVLLNLPKTTLKTEAKVRPTVSLEEMMKKLQTRIEKQIRTKFSEIRRFETEHKNVIVSFLAILELFKQGNVIVTQANRFEDIHLELDKAATPKYY